MIIRTAVGQDWPRIYPFFSLIVAAGRTYAFPEDLSLDGARPWWMEEPPGRTVVALDGDTVLGSAKMGPNRPGRGSHVATARHSTMAKRSTRCPAPLPGAPSIHAGR